ncbi:MAG: mechanosensitive ion channel [Clostridia bacterium]|nr:mechanosensitive ion channel [Clostridia bacterium]
MEWKDALSMIERQGMRFLAGLAVLIIGLILARWIIRLSQNKLKIKKMDPTLLGFLRNLARFILYAVVVLTAISVMGIPLTSVVTIVASAGVAISLAMQGALSNFVGGLTLLLFKPIKAGDYVKVGDLEGTVQTIGAFYTEMNTFDNRHISMPNSSLTNTAIINYTRQGTRRLDEIFSVSYNSDMQQVFQVLNGLIARNPAILPDPAPVVHLNQFGESSLQYVVRVWCKTADYWDIHFYLLEEGKRALDAAGIEIPLPQMDVHVK